MTEVVLTSGRQTKNHVWTLGCNVPATSLKGLWILGSLGETGDTLVEGNISRVGVPLGLLYSEVSWGAGEGVLRTSLLYQQFTKLSPEICILETKSLIAISAHMSCEIWVPVLVDGWTNLT